MSRNETQLNKHSTRVENKLKSLERVLADLAMHVNPPSGFAACWKQQPVMLEDAHGIFIAIPLDVVVSWQVRVVPNPVARTNFKNLKRCSIAFCRATFALCLA